MSQEPFNRDFYDENDFEADEVGIGGKGPGEIRDIRNKIVDATSRMKDQAGQVASKISSTVGEERDHAAGSLRRAAHVIHDKATEVPGGSKAEGVAHTIANGMEWLADHVRDANLENIKNAALETCRKYPAQTLVSALVVGFLTGRAIRR